MDKIKKQFKDFKNYYKLIRYGVNIGNGETFKSYLPVLICLIIGIMVAYIQFLVERFSGGFSIPMDVFILPFFIGATIGIGVVTLQKPSLISVAPFTPKQRKVFSYLAIFLRAIIIYVITVVAIIGVMFLVACIFSLYLGEFVFVVEGGLADSIVLPSPYEESFRMLFCATYFFATVAICNIGRATYRNIACISFTVATFIISFIFTAVNGYLMDIASETYVTYYFTIDLKAYFEFSKYPWISIVFLSITTVAAFILSVISVNRRFKNTVV